MTTNRTDTARPAERALVSFLGLAFCLAWWVVFAAAIATGHGTHFIIVNGGLIAATALLARARHSHSR